MSSLNFLLKYTNEQKVCILSKFGRTVDSIKEDVEAIKLWLEKQPQIPKNLEDNFIENVLVANKFIYSNAKRNIDWYFRIRNVYPAYFKDPDETSMVATLNHFYMFPLPKMTASNARVVLLKIRNKELDPNITAQSLCALGINIADLIKNYDCPASYILVLDGRDYTFEFLSRFSPVILRTVQNIAEKAYRNSIQEIHTIHINPILETFANLIKSFMNPKIAARFKLHRDSNSLFEFVPKEILPKDLGGDEISLEEIHELWKEEWKQKLSWFKQRKLLVSDESLRIEEVPDCDLLGAQGNFRKLTLD